METMNESLTDLDFSVEDDAWNTCFEEQASEYLPTESGVVQSGSSQRLDGSDLGNFAAAPSPESSFNQSFHVSGEIVACLRDVETSAAEIAENHDPESLEMSGGLGPSLQGVAVGVPEAGSIDGVETKQSREPEPAREQTNPQTVVSSPRGSLTRRGYLRSAQDEELKRQYREEQAAVNSGNAQDEDHKADQNAVVHSLLERLNAIDRTSAETALEEIDAILSEEREREKRDSVLSHISEQTNDEGSNASSASLDLGALAPSRRSLLEPERSLNFADLQQEAGPASSMPEQRRMVSDAIDIQGNLRPGAYSAPGRAIGQRPTWGRGENNNGGRRFSLRGFSFGPSFSRAQPDNGGQTQPSVQAVLVSEDKKRSEELIRDRVTQEVREELVSEMITESVSAVPVDPNEIKKRKRRFAMGVCLVVVLVAAVVGLSVGLTTANSGSDASEQTESPLDVIATVQETICYDRFPGQGHSLGVLCERSDTEPQGGGVANVVCKAWLDQTETADFCITNSGACRADFGAGEYQRKDPAIMLPFNNTLEILEMTGEQVVQALNDGIRFALDPLFGTTGAYPYGHAIRYDVDATLRIVTNVWVNPRMKNDEWNPIEIDRVYKVLTHSFLAGGGDNYCTMQGIPESKRNHTGKPWDVVLLEYAIEAEVITDLPPEEYSTQNYTRPPDGDREICFE